MGIARWVPILDFDLEGFSSWVWIHLSTCHGPFSLKMGPHISSFSLKKINGQFKQAFNKEADLG
jgi:hypothetical protein